LDDLKIVIVDPHIFHFKKILAKFLKGEKQYLRYEAFFDFFLNTGKLAILRTGKATSFRRKLLRDLFLTKFFNYIEFFLWIKINKITKKIKCYSKISQIDPTSHVIYDLGVGWNKDKSDYLSELENFRGLVIVNMTHYNRNSNMVFRVLPNLYCPVISSEGLITNSDIFSLFYSGNLNEIHVPFVIDHLIKYFPSPKPIRIIQTHKDNLTLDEERRINKCLIMGSIGPHMNSKIYKFSKTQYLNPQRALFREKTIGLPDFFHEPKVGESQHDFSGSSIDELYSRFSMFFTGVEIIQIPSMNVLEGMYFGCAYVGPDDTSHSILGLIDGVNYFAYQSGNFDSFINVVNKLVSNPDLVSKVAAAGQLFVKNKFVGKLIYRDFFKKVVTLHQEQITCA
jgi:hypothetical protein